MAIRRTKAAIAAGQPTGADPTEYVGRDEHGRVRPADDRYLEDAELDARDAYVLEQTGPDAQQLVAKRDGLRIRLEQLTDEQLASYMPPEFEGSRPQLLEQLTENATAMPNADYRALLATLDKALGDDEQEETPVTAKKPHPLGETVKAAHVVRPDGAEYDVADGLYVLDVPGVHVVDGDKITVSDGSESDASPGPA